MIQSGRIRDVGLQFENKLVGKPLYLHGFILGLFYGALIQVTLPVCFVPSSSGVHFVLCMQFVLLLLHQTEL